MVVAVVLLVALAVGGKAYIDRQWFVGVDEGRVAIFKGIPSDVLGLDLSTVVETTDLAADDAQQLSSWSELDRGIAVDDRADAEALVEQIRADLQGGQAAPGDPGSSSSPTGGG